MINFKLQIFLLKEKVGFDISINKHLLLEGAL